MLWKPNKLKPTWLLWCTEMFLGFVVACLGMLDIGHHSVDLSNPDFLHHTNPWYHFVGTCAPLGVVAAVYALVWAVAILTVELRNRQPEDMWRWWRWLLKIL
jgi:hypothetical protein